MLNLLELEQLAAFAAEGTLSKAAEKLHISQPTITRTMQHLEEDFGVPLFQQTKNHIALNETGWKAVEYAERLLKSAEEAVEGVRSFDRSLHTITVSSCAPAPLWGLLPALTRTFPDMTISSSIKGNEAVLNDLQSGSVVLGVLSEDMVPQDYSSIPLLKEDLYVCLPGTHELAGYKELSFEQLNGYNFLLGREAMVCCSEDTSLIALWVFTEQELPEVGTWLQISGTISVAYDADYGGEVCMIKETERKVITHLEDYVYFT